MRRVGWMYPCRMISRLLGAEACLKAGADDKDGEGESCLEKRSLGRTGLTVSALGFGASPLGGVFGRVDEAEGIRAVHYAIDEGINLFDVSPYYGLTRAESVLGRALVGRRQQVILATKAGRITENHFDFSKAGIKRSVEESLRRLHTDYVDILQAHDIEFGAPSQVFGEAYEALQELKQEGKCRFIGMTAYPLSVLKAAISHCQLDVIISYGHFCLYNTLLVSDLAPLARQKGTGIINASPTGMGLLTPKELPEWHPAPAALAAACKRAVAECAADGVKAVDVALQYVYRQRSIPTTLVGMSKISHVRQNVEAVCRPLDGAVLQRVKEVLQPMRDAVWPSGTHQAEYERM